MRRMKFTIASASLLLLTAACANTGAGYRPVVDGPVGMGYEADLAACQNLAAQQRRLDGNAARNAAAGAAVLGGTTAVLNNEGTNVRDAALVGAAAGLGASAMQQQENRAAIVRNCMRSRGYNVVG